jgi:hypothetical protein
VLKAFIDDSGSGGDSPWYVLARYLGTVEGCDSFDAQWNEVLHRNPRVEYFKLRIFDLMGSGAESPQNNAMQK